MRTLRGYVPLDRDVCLMLRSDLCSWLTVIADGRVGHSCNDGRVLRRGFFLCVVHLSVCGGCGDV
jgi:hypothetical protein